MNTATEKIPTWSLCYLINGDATGLTDDEIRMADKWMDDWQVQIVSPVTDEEGNAQPYSHTVRFSDFLPKWKIVTYFI